MPAPSNLVTEAAGLLELFRDVRAVCLLELDHIPPVCCRHLLFLRGKGTHILGPISLGAMEMVNICW